MHNPILQRRRSGLFKGQDGAPLNLNATKKRPERDGLPTPERVSPPVPVPVTPDRKSFRNGDGLSTRSTGQTTPPVFLQKKQFSFAGDNLREKSRENLFSKSNTSRTKCRNDRARRRADDLLADDNYKRFVIMTISMSLFIIVVISISLYQMINKKIT